MLADDADLGNLKFPFLVSPKLDGVRAVSVNGILRSRSMKEFPNPQVNSKLCSEAPLDGELILGDPTSKSVFRDTMKCVMSHVYDVKELRLFVFDLVKTNTEFRDRLEQAANYCDGSQIVHLPHRRIETLDELLTAEEEALNLGYEGVMLRHPRGPYKFGRATAREGWLMKVKRHCQSEARVLGFVELMHNWNELGVDALGYAERSSHQANLVPAGRLGALMVQDVKSGVEFNIGTGFDDAERNEIWMNKSAYIGKWLTYKYLPVGVKDKPRHPVFLGWRAEGV
jgi:DNA ligase-1